MKLKELFSRVYVAIVILLTMLLVSSIFVYFNNKALVKSNESRYNSILIAEELRKSSDDLSSSCRSYIETGDITWRKKYFETLAIRNGEKPRPDGAQISLQDSMKCIGFTDAELNKLIEAEKNSNDLAKIEIVAIHIIDSLNIKNSDELSDEYMQDLLRANQLVYSGKYSKSKMSIMKPITECIRMVKDRTQIEVDRDTRINRMLLHLIIFLIIFISLFVLISFYIINKKISRQFSDLQKAKADAEQNEQNFRLLFELSPDIILIRTLEGELIDCNPAGLKFHGAKTVDELKSVNFSKYYLNFEDRKVLLKELEEVGYINNKEAKIKNFSTGIIVDCLMSVKLAKTKQYGTIIISWIKDISEKKKADDRILKLSTAVSQSPAAVVITNLKGNIEYVNKQFSNISGYSYEELIGKNPRLLKSGLHPKEFYEDLWKTVLSKNTWYGEIYNKRKDGSYFWESATIAPILNDKEEIINMVAIKQDITSRKLAEFELIESQKKLKELNDTKNKLFSIIGHDLRGPIGTLKSFIEVIIEQKIYDDKESLKQMLDVLLKSTESTYDLLQNLLMWAKSQQNEVVFMPEKFDLHQIVDLKIALVSEMAKNKNITIHNQIPDEQYIHADMNMIMTVIRNLLTNAIKFTENGKNIYLSISEENSLFTISVKDEGIGISPENIDKLFNTKVTFSTNGTTGEKGTGLGLLICKDFIERHNGKIWVESEPGKGSIFHFTLPVISETENV
jgi:PAS domain S-box-containing protein